MSPTPALEPVSALPVLRTLAAACAVVALAVGGCGGSAIHQAPANPTAEGSEGQVELTWTAVPDASKYTIRWEDQTAGETGFPNSISDLTDTSYVHTGLIDFHTYRYQIYASGGGGQGPGSVIVSAEPGPVPGVVEWAAVVTEGTTQKIFFAPATDADSYRVYVGTSPEQLAGRRPSAGYLTADASPYLREDIATNLAAYYRVIAMNGPRIGFGGPVVISPTFTVGAFDLQSVAPALADADGDDCLDLPAAKGDCSAGFAELDLATAGLSDLFATGRVNGDSRFLDVNADGKPDLFSDVRSAATDTASRAILYINQGDDVFQADAGVAVLGIGGFGGTVLAADFDNDGDVDIFAPHDWTGTDGGRNWLLLNGGGSLVDSAAAAGLQTGPAGAAYVPGGGQAVDFNEDGRIDILFGSRLMINNGDGTFTDASAAAGLSAVADQGLRLFDVDMDGDLDLIRRDANVTRLYLNSGGVFGPATVIDGDATTQGAGLAVCDVNSDGFEDVVVASNDVATGIGAPHLYVNVNGMLMRSAVPEETVADTGDLLAANDLLSCGDLDGSGVADIVSRWDTYRVLRSVLGLGSVLRIRVLGAGGEYNQQGRIVRIVPAGTTGRTMTRVIESGSGLRAQGQYDLLVGAPWSGDYEISVRFKDGWITTTAQQGDALTIYEDGRVAEGLQ